MRHGGKCAEYYGRCVDNDRDWSRRTPATYLSNKGRTMNLERYRQNNPVLAGILDRVALIRGYQAIVDGLISGRSGQSVQVLNIDERTLTLGVTSAAMASR